MDGLFLSRGKREGVSDGFQDDSSESLLGRPKGGGGRRVNKSAFLLQKQSVITRLVRPVSTQTRLA